MWTVVGSYHDLTVHVYSVAYISGLFSCVLRTNHKKNGMYY